MKVSDIMSFINPLGDGLSTFFVLTLIGLSIATTVWLLMSANEEHWENNWNGGCLDDDTSLDSENGSVIELSEAVATKAEQVANIIPGMLLIIGLLGTFIGLGIALNSASAVLASANTASMDNAMANLMALMEGLGAKFKTSTWGLFCFIVLNILFNAFGVKEKRLAWTISKVREQIRAKHEKNSKTEQNRHEQIIDIMIIINQKNQENSQNVINTIKQGFEVYIEQAHQDSINHTKELTNIATSSQAIQKASEYSTQELKKITYCLSEGFEKSNEYLRETQNIIYTLKQDFESYIKQVQQDNLNYIKELTNIVNSNHAIQKASEYSTQELKKITNSLNEGFRENNEYLKDSSEQLLLQLKKIADYNQQTQRAMQDFVDKTVSSMSSIGSSADKMGESAKAVGESAGELNMVIKTLKSEMGEVMTRIKTDLGDTIHDMSDSFKDNMAQMSNSMSSATEGISVAVESLSINVGQTMTEVTQTINESMDLQKKSATEFTLTSTTLNEQIVAMTNLTKQLSEDITSSLDSVAQNGRRMESIGKSLKEFSEFIESLQQTNPKILESLTSIDQNIKLSLQKNSSTTTSI